MKFLKESLLSFFVIGLVLYLYVLAAGAELLNLCGFASSGGEPEAAQHFKIAAA